MSERCAAFNASTHVGGMSFEQTTWEVGSEHHTMSEGMPTICFNESQCLESLDPGDALVGKPGSAYSNSQPWCVQSSIWQVQSAGEEYDSAVQEHCSRSPEHGFDYALDQVTNITSNDNYLLPCTPVRTSFFWPTTMEGQVRPTLALRLLKWKEVWQEEMKCKLPMPESVIDWWQGHLELPMGTV